jgi:hypothetical protein
MSEREKLIEKMARGIFDALEGPMANQDYGRQMKQWERAKEIATAALSAIEAEAVIVPREIDDETAQGVWSAAYDEWAEYGASDQDAGRAGFTAMIAASPYRRT